MRIIPISRPAARRRDRVARLPRALALAIQAAAGGRVGADGDPASGAAVRRQFPTAAGAAS